MTAAAGLRARGQGGFTLMEVLMVSALSAMIAVPVLGWMLSSFRAQATVLATSQRTQVTTQITQILPRDLSSARAVLYTSVGGPVASATQYDCSDADPNDVVAVSMLNGRGTGYVVFAAGTRDGETVVVRRTCGLGAPTADENVLGYSIRATPDAVLSATPRLGGSFPAATVSGVNLTIALPDSRPIEISGSLRTGMEAP